MVMRKHGVLFPVDQGIVREAPGVAPVAYWNDEYETLRVHLIDVDYLAYPLNGDSMEEIYFPFSVGKVLWEGTYTISGFTLSARGLPYQLSKMGQVLNGRLLWPMMRILFNLFKKKILVSEIILHLKQSSPDQLGDYRHDIMVALDECNLAVHIPLPRP